MTRRYNEKEVSRLLKRAAELQRSERSVPSPAGLTLGELEDIAAEAGLDVSSLRRAAAELESAGSTGASGLGRKLAGAPTRILLEHTLPFEAPEKAFDELAPIIQVGTDAPGQLSQVGRTLSWNSQSQANPGALTILVSVRKGETVIRIEERFGNLAGGLFGGVVGGAGGGLGIGAGGAIATTLGGGAFFAIIPAVVGGIYLGVRSIFKSVVNRRKRTLEQLMERILEVLGQHAPSD
ncbi:MAG: hypothetical protein PVH00_11210 [Gemmatimonadota bacterium]